MRRLALLTLSLLLGLTAMAWAEGPIVRKSTARTTFTEPQTSVDGSNLEDLREYRMYLDRTAIGVQAMTTPTFVIPAPALDPAPGAALTTVVVRQLAVGQWYMQVSAVDTSNNEGPRNPVSPFVLQDDVSPAAPGTAITSDL